MAREELEFILDFAKNAANEIIDPSIVEDAHDVSDIVIKYLVKMPYERT